MKNSKNVYLWFECTLMKPCSYVKKYTCNILLWRKKKLRAKLNKFIFGFFPFVFSSKLSEKAGVSQWNKKFIHRIIKNAGIYRANVSLVVPRGIVKTCEHKPSFQHCMRNDCSNNQRQIEMCYSLWLWIIVNVYKDRHWYYYCYYRGYNKKITCNKRVRLWHWLLLIVYYIKRCFDICSYWIRTSLVL